MYSAQLLDHFEHPRNAGVLEAPYAIAQLENPVCGDVLALSARIFDGRIAEIRFKAKGCVPAMACGSALTELASGKTLSDAAAIRKQDLESMLGGLPHASSHAAQLAIDTLALLLRQREQQDRTLSAARI
jgi:nitrogen fixation protein NifU and related proteins